MTLDSPNHCRDRPQRYSDGAVQLEGVRQEFALDPARSIILQPTAEQKDQICQRVPMFLKNHRTAPGGTPRSGKSIVSFLAASRGSRVELRGSGEQVFHVKL